MAIFDEWNHNMKCNRALCVRLRVVWVSDTWEGDTWINNMIHTIGACRAAPSGTWSPYPSSLASTGTILSKASDVDIGEHLEQIWRDLGLKTLRNRYTIITKSWPKSPPNSVLRALVTSWSRLCHGFGSVCNRDRVLWGNSLSRLRRWLWERIRGEEVLSSEG